jgi:hypothetical protein
MTHDRPTAHAIGFLTVIEDPDLGLFGGYLILNRSGRPLEFHCTAPVRPNRAQQILYGPTLEPFLHGELIGRTLIERAETKPSVVVTNGAAVLAARPFVAMPVLLLLSGGAVPDGRWECFELAAQRVAVPSQHAGDRQRVLADLPKEWFDLAEPFQRIGAAIQEARSGGSRAAA